MRGRRLDRWPECTISGCRHGIEWASLDERTDAVRRHLADWVTARGEAQCRCHGGAFPLDAFPCDEGGHA